MKKGRDRHITVFTQSDVTSQINKVIIAVLLGFLLGWALAYLFFILLQ